MTKTNVPTEDVVFEIDKDGMRIIETKTRMMSMDDNTQVVCDICSKPLGKIKDMKHVLSPESITIAVRNGYRPEKMMKASKDMLIEMGEEKYDEIIEKIFEGWKSMVDQSETPWALCDDCFKNIQQFLKKPIDKRH
jgi:hypothetical protein